MIGAASVAIVIAKPRYSSAGSLYVQNGSLVVSLNDLPRDGGSIWLTPSQIAVNQIKELLQTEAFVRPLVKGTPFETKMADSPEKIAEVMKDVNKAVSVGTGGDNLIAFSAENEDPQVAYQLARQLTESYVLWKLNSDRQDSIAAQSFFTDLIQPRQDTLDKARKALEDYIRLNPAPVRGERPELEKMEVERLQAEVSQAQQRVEEVQQKEESARLAQIQAERGIRQTYLIIDAPKQPTKPVNGLRVRILGNIIFVLIGIVISFLGIIGGAVLDRSFRFPIDVAHALHLPVLAVTLPSKLIGPVVTTSQAELKPELPDQPIETVANTPLQQLTSMAQSPQD
jgi:capsular polysaccharide biosynthesis protein